ncbi:MAG: FMN-binding glutamate synthase family protein [Bacillota bacterium]|nr:FMN-binding glutamate synthase family protein [Bacillota bacterium]
MNYSKGINASAATLTRNRTPDSVSAVSGLCATCVEGCPGLCEVGRSAIRGVEAIYPQPFGTMTTGAQKVYPVDFSHFNIMGTAVGAQGIEADSDKAIFPAVSLETAVGAAGDLKLSLPAVIPGLGSTRVARDNWEGLAIGAALSGVILTIGENVCGMDQESEIVHGRVRHSPDLKRRVTLYQEWANERGAIVVQANVEDTRLGVLEYAIEELGVEAVELKWGQGAKNIGGEVKVPSLDHALELKKRGYIVLPDPEDPTVQEAFRSGAFREFERHSRVGMVEEEAFHRRVEQLRRVGARYVFLKTGAYRPADLARAVKWASDAGIDLLTVDGAGGGTGMSPWRMMNEWGIPTVFLEALLVSYLDRLAARKAYLPPVAIAGGFALEDQIFKGLALGAPYVKAVGVARAPLTAVLVGKTVGRMLTQGKVPPEWAKYGDQVEQVFVAAHRLRAALGKDFAKLPPSAIALVSYFERVAQGLRQFMCGARKFRVDLLGRDDLVALTPEAARVTGVPYVMEADAAEAEEILSGRAVSLAG